MRELPSGNVTFLFTDIEGSTKLLYELGDAYAGALAEHRRLLRDAFERHRGVEVDTQGDAFFVAFAHASDALTAAAEAQAALATGPILVRMGLHTGEPHVTDQGYVGLDVHRAARIAAVGHGGQVLVSRSTANLVSTHRLRDLGEHRLKDFPEPVALFQLGDASFPPLNTISNTNLPHPASSFVGRTREVQAVLAQLTNGARLLTLTGSGGSGKTRLAIEAGAELVPHFKAGVFWVGLAAVRDPHLVSAEISKAIGAKGVLAEHVSERELLLILDNLEQVIDAAPELAALVELCPNLRILVTSRELLRVRGEVEYPVEPLADTEAVDLFCERARTEPTDAVSELCGALDRLPLALELAAARTSVLSPAQILERLSERLDLFKGGRDAVARHQTLRATIEWSYDLLAPEEQRLFARLAVFSRGCTVEAAQDVAAARLDTLQSLVDKGLVRHSAERFWMLETIREFAAERLRDSRELAEMSARHAEHFFALAEDTGAELRGSHPSEAIVRVEQDLENIRRAFRWSIEQGGLDTAFAIFVSLERFWVAHGCPEDFLALIDAKVGTNANSVDEELRAEALWVAGFQAARVQEFERPRRLVRQALELFEKLGKGYETVRCLSELAIIEQEQGLENEATELAEQSLAIAHELDDPRAVSAASSCLATLAYWRRDFARAAGLYEEALRGYQRAGDSPGPIAAMLYNIGLAARALEDYDRAESALRESFDVATRAGFAVFIGISATGLGYVMLARGELGAARSRLRQGLEVLVELANPQCTASALNLAAAIAVVGAEYRTAARLWGAVDALLADAASPEVPDERVRESFEAVAQSALGSGEFGAVLQEGHQLPLAQALESAMQTASENYRRSRSSR